MATRDRTTARLTERLEQQHRELQALAEINRAIATSPEPEHVLQRIVEEASKLIRADGAGIAVVRPGEDELWVGPAVGVMEAPPNRRIPLDHSITGRAVRTGRPEIISDVDRDPEQYPLSPEPVTPRSAVVVPLRSPHAVIGALLVVRGEELPPFGEEQRDALQRFADQAAIVLEQARLIEGLREANRTKEAFLATLSHELRTPLTGILLWTDMLGAEPRVRELDNGDEALEVITQSAQLLLAMVNDLLELSRLEAGKLRMERQSTDVTVLARQALSAFRKRGAEDTGVVLVDELPPRLPAVSVDPARMHQVICNLLSNAVKFTEPPGRVVMRAEVDRRDGVMRMAVEDTGIGIPPDVLPHIFERFRQGCAGPNRRRGGLGVGLTVADAIVKAHGGRIRVETEEGQGSTFTVEIPLTEDTATDGDMDDTGATDPAMGPDGRGESPRGAEERELAILIAEDVDETRQALATLLTAQGYRVLEAHDGEEAVAVARRERPAAILMDIAMPNADGITAFETLRGDPETRDIPIAAVTARAMPEDRRRVEATGFDAYLVKPFRISELLSLLDSLLGPAPESEPDSEPAPA